MKILHYYWTQPDDKNHRGGGIQVYLKNIVDEQIKEKQEVFTLNSGIEYSIFCNHCFIKEIHRGNKFRQFSIYNAPVPAPAKAGFYYLTKYINDMTVKAVIKQFIDQYGPFDLIHFHSLEGISLPVLELKKHYPKTIFLYTMHNYFLFCPQVNLWSHEQECCYDYKNGKCCADCISYIPKKNIIKWYYRLCTFLQYFHGATILQKGNHWGRFIYQKIKGNYACSTKSIALIFHKPHAIEDGTSFRLFREANVNYVNTYMDGVICVSQRVRTISRLMGIKPPLLHTLYIGTVFSEKQFLYPASDIYKNPFCISYIGYMKKAKGFYFFLNALKQLSPKIASHIKVIIAAHQDDQLFSKEIKKLQGKFFDVQYYDGYNHKNLRYILQGCHLGVVPVLWEDNMPQVAMEYKALGVPVLSSDRGGAAELTGAEEFHFRAGDTQEFIEKIIHIMNHREILSTYYKKGMKLYSVREHDRLLMDICREIQDKLNEKS